MQCQAPSRKTINSKDPLARGVSGWKGFLIPLKSPVRWKSIICLGNKYWVVEGEEEEEEEKEEPLSPPGRTG